VCPSRGPGPQDPSSPDVRELIRELRSTSPQKRDEAFARLRDLGGAAASELEKAARDTDPEVAARARTLLRRLEIRSGLPDRLRQIVPGVEDRLVAGGDRACTELFLELSAPEKGRRVSRVVLGYLAAPALRGASTAEERKKICEAAAARSLAGAGPEIVKLLRDGGEAVRVAALQALGRLQFQPAMAEILTRAREGEEKESKAACTELARLGGRDAARLLLGLLKDEKARVRVAAIVALAEREETAREAIPAILDRLADKEASVRAAAVRALHHLRVTEAVPSLKGLLRDSDLSTRTEAAFVLAEVDPKSAIPALRRMLAQEEDPPTLRIIDALRCLNAQEAVPDLKALLKDLDEGYRAAAAAALGLGDREGAPILLEEAEERDLVVDLFALNALRQPEAWKRLKEARCHGREQDLLKDLPELLARQAKMRLENPAGFPRWIAGEGACLVREPGESTRHTVLDLVRELGSGVVLESDAVRLPGPGDDPVRFWRSWAGAAPPK